MTLKDTMLLKIPLTLGKNFLKLDTAKMGGDRKSSGRFSKLITGAFYLSAYRTAAAATP